MDGPLADGESDALGSDANVVEVECGDPALSAELAEANYNIALLNARAVAGLRTSEGYEAEIENIKQAVTEAEALAK